MQFKKKLIRVSISLALVMSLLITFALPTFALNWDGSHTGGSGGGSPAGPKGFAIRTTGDNCLGYRFSVVNKHGDIQGDFGSMDIFRNTTYGNQEFSSAHKFNSKMNKLQLIANQNAPFSTSATTANCKRETEIGFYSSLPTPEGIEYWQSDKGNLNPILNILGIGSIDDLINGDKILVEPLFDVRLESVYHAVTVTELALYGRYLLGANSNGGTSNVSASWGFISAYTNRIYPNAMYTPDGQGIINSATPINGRETFHNLINYGYGIGIAYSENKPDFNPTLTPHYAEFMRIDNNNNMDKFYGPVWYDMGSNHMWNEDIRDGYPVYGEKVGCNVYFNYENQPIRVRQTVVVQTNMGREHIKEIRDIVLDSNTGSGRIFPIEGRFDLTNILSTILVVSVSMDWIDDNGNIIKKGSGKEYLMSIAPKTGYPKVETYDIEGNILTSSTTNETTGVTPYVGQKITPKYFFQNESRWDECNFKGSLLENINGNYQSAYQGNNGNDLFIEKFGLSAGGGVYNQFSSLKDYVIQNNNPIKFDMRSYWNRYDEYFKQKSERKNTFEIQPQKADLELLEVVLCRFIKASYVPVDGPLYEGEIVVPRYKVRENNISNSRVFYNVYNTDGEKSYTYKLTNNQKESYIFASEIQITVPKDVKEYTAWGGVFLDSAGIYNTKYETIGLNNSRIKSYEVKPSLEIIPITPNRPYRVGTEAVISFKVINHSWQDITPNDNVRITIETEYNSNFDVFGGKQVVCPANSENIVYAKGNFNDIQFEKGKDDIKISCRLRDVNNFEELGKVEFTNKILDVNTMETTDTKFEYRPTDFWLQPPPIDKNETASWNEWEYKDNQFIFHVYGIGFGDDKKSILYKPQITPDLRRGGDWKDREGNWKMRSGYGISMKYKSVVSPLDSSIYEDPRFISNNPITKVPTAFCYFPEFKYLSNMYMYRALVTRPWETPEDFITFPINPSAKDPGEEPITYYPYHFTPLWFPDGDYIVSVKTTDLWTPAGMIESQRNSNAIKIDGDCYDDWYQTVTDVTPKRKK